MARPTLLLRCGTSKVSQVTLLVCERERKILGWVRVRSVLPRQEHFTAGYERDVALFPQGRPHALESPGEDIHGEFAAAFRVFDKEGDTGREPAGGRAHATESVTHDKRLNDGVRRSILPAEPVVHPVLHDREQPSRDSTCERGVDVLSETDESLEDDDKGGEEGAGPDRVEGGAVQIRRWAVVGPRVTWRQQESPPPHS